MLEVAGLPVKLDVFLKLNTGMNRLGFKPDELACRAATPADLHARRQRSR